MGSGMLQLFTLETMTESVGSITYAHVYCCVFPAKLVSSGNLHKSSYNFQLSSFPAGQVICGNLVQILIYTAHILVTR